MRAALYAVGVWAWALLAGCLAAPTPKDWLAVGFRTPEATFGTFQTALRADQGQLEYLCLGAEFKRRVGASLFGYLEYRRELFQAQPWLKWAAMAEIEEVQRLSEHRVRLVAKVDTWLHDETFAVEVVREDYWELYVDGQRRHDDEARWRSLAREHEGELTVRVPLPEGLSAAEVSELRAGREWKIDAFLEFAPGSESP
jgi:hypothetical protein